MGSPLSSRLALAAIASLAFVTACDRSGSKRVVGRNAAPRAESALAAPPAYGAVVLTVDLVDFESDLLDVTLEFSLDDGATWQPARVVSGTLLDGLPSDPSGVPTVIVWDALADVGFRNVVTARLRVTPEDQYGPGGSAEATTDPIDNLQAAVDAVQFPMVHYGALDTATVAIAEQHDLVVLHPHGADLTRALVSEIQDGIDPDDPADDVIVLGYVSIGEDVRTIGLTDAELLLDPRFTGDGTGPRIDPRGPNADGGPLTGLDPLGLPSNGGTGYASWYLDDNSVDNDPGDVGDGLPDRNGNFDGCFVNAGDPAWFNALLDMSLDGADNVAGLREVLTTGFGRGLGCDGVFLDTIDTCAPNSYTDGASANQSEFEWTAAGFGDFMSLLRSTFPEALVLQNRGVFLFDPRLPHYAVTTRPLIDLILFESYRLNSSTAEEYNDFFFADNKYNFAPKLMAEANRTDGFRVLSLGYAEGPPATMDTMTLVGGSSLGLASLLDDIYEVQELVGFRHYLTDATIRLPNTFVLQHADLSDAVPPDWSSTYNANIQPFPTPALPPDPRVGIQRVASGLQSVTVSWDVALDENRVGYALYMSTAPLDFVGDPLLTTATRTVLPSTPGAGYEDGVGPDVFAHEHRVQALTQGTTYWFCIRAFDRLGNEETNQVELSAAPFDPVTIDGDFSDWASAATLHTDPADVPASAGPDWREIRVVNDTDALYVYFSSDDAFNLDGSPTYGFSRTFVFIDADDDPLTGYAIGSIGSELMVAGASLYTQATGVFNAGFVGAVAIEPQLAVTECELAVPLPDIYAQAPGTMRVRLLFVNDDVNDFAPDAGSILYTIQQP